MAEEKKDMTKWNRYQHLLAKQRQNKLSPEEMGELAILKRNYQNK